MIQIKRIIHERTQKMVDEDQNLAESMNKDQTSITFIIAVQFLLKVLQLVAILLVGSYLLGMLWYIMCK